MLTLIHTESDLDLALAALTQPDPSFHLLMATAGRPPLRWRRAVAARVLWSYYRAVKGRDGAPIPPTRPPRRTTQRGIHGP